MSINTIPGRLGMLCTFFDRIIEWDWDDAPARTPIYTTDLLRPDEPLPKSSTTATRCAWPGRWLLSPIPRRLVLELLSRTGGGRGGVSSPRRDRQ